VDEMKNLTRHVPMVFAFVFATVTSVMVYQFLKGKEGIVHATPAGDLTISVVIASRDLAMGMRLAEEDLTTQEWPKSIVNDQYFQNAKQLIGRTSRVNISKDEPITSPKVLREGENFSALIPPDMRAVTVPIRKSNAFANLIDRGTVVDVIAMFDKGEAPPSTKVIAQAVRVLAVHDRDSSIEGKMDSKMDEAKRFMEVTLVVTPRQAEWLVIGMNAGVIQLVVRNDRAPLA
jgi:pilus assembly protein CpaB